MTDKFSFKVILILCLSLLFSSCMPPILRYELAEKPDFKSMAITGLTEDQKIIEVSDKYKDNLSDGTNFWIVIQENGEYKIGMFNLTNGKVTDLKALKDDEYNPENPFYWDNLQVSKQGFFGACCGACMAQTAIGGTTDKYSFNATKYVWGNKEFKIMISYSFVLEQKTINYGGSRYSHGDTEVKTKSQGQCTQQFIKGEDFINIENFTGYDNGFSTKAVTKTRYYRLTDNIFTSIQPMTLDMTETSRLFIYDLEKKSSWGAELQFKEQNYVDAAVSKDGSIIGILVGTPGKYELRQYDTKSYIRAVKTLITVQD
jgi:hypothetical protein